MLSALVVAIAAVTKFVAGAWVVVVLVPLICSLACASIVATSMHAGR